MRAPYSDCIARLSHSHDMSTFFSWAFVPSSSSPFWEREKAHLIRAVGVTEGSTKVSLSSLFCSFLLFFCVFIDETKMWWWQRERERERESVCYFFVCDGQIDTGALTWHWWKRAGSLTQCSSFTVRRRRAYIETDGWEKEELRKRRRRRRRQANTQPDDSLKRN